MRIAVAIPTFIRDVQNGRLLRCLNSIEMQTRRPDIVSISASSCKRDDLQPIFDCSYSFQLHVQTFEHAQTAATNRNAAIDYLVGHDVDIVTFFDSDDIMVPYRIEYLERAFTESTCAYLLHNFIHLLSPPISRPTIPFTDYQLITNAFQLDERRYCGVRVKPTFGLINPEVAHGHVTVRKCILLTERYKNDVNGVLWEDSEFVRRLSLLGHEGMYMYTPLSEYHQYR